MGSAAESTAVTHLTSVSQATASATVHDFSRSRPRGSRCPTRGNEPDGARARAWRGVGVGEGGAAGEPSHWKVLRRSPSAPVAGPEPAAAPFFLSPQVRAALRSRSERASRQSRGRRRLWEQLRAAWGGGELEGAEAELLGREPAREWRLWIPGGARTRGGWSSARTLAARSSGPVALSSLLGDLNPFIPTPPLRLRQDRPVGEGRRR